MSAKNLSRLGAIALTLAVASACDVVPLNQRMPYPSQPPGPVIERLSASAAKDAGLTFAVFAADRDGKALKYTWEASHGTFDVTNRSTVTWKPVKKDGTPEAAGLGQVRVIVSNGKETESLSQIVTMDGAGGATIYVPVFSAPTPRPSPSPASPGASAPPSGAQVACTVGSVSPTLVAPGTLFTISGTGLTKDLTISVGGRPAAVLDVTPTLITAKLPADIAFGTQGLKVQVTTCGETKEATGQIEAYDTAAFGGGVAQAGRGLLATATALDARNERLPVDLDGRTPAFSYLATHLDVGPGGFRFGFPGEATAYYGIRYAGLLDIKAAGLTKFSLTADDTAKLYIDGKLVLDHDESLLPNTRDGEVTLTAGKHKIQVDYHQGDRAGATLQLYWTPAGAARESVIPAEAFSLGE